MAVQGVLLAVFLVVIASWTILRLAPLHPAQMWSVPWAIASGLYAMRLLPYRELSWQTCGLAAGSAAAFVAATLLMTRDGGGRSMPASARYDAVAAAAVLAAALTVIGLIAFLAQAINRYGFTGAVTSPAPLRHGIATAHFTITIKYIYAAITATALAGIAAGFAPTRKSCTYWLCFAALSTLCVFFATGRATVVDTAFVGVVAFALARPARITRRTLVAGIGALLAGTLVVFLAGGAIIGKTYANNPDLRRIPSVFSDGRILAEFALPYQYASAPIAALDVQVGASTTWGDAHGCALAHTLCVGLRHLGLSVPIVRRIRPFTSPPLPWNTYTALDVPLIDWGSALVVPFVAILGVIMGFLWRAAAAGDPRWLLAYAVESVAVLTSAGSFNFTAPYLIGAVLIGLALLWLCGRGMIQGLRARAAFGRT